MKAKKIILWTCLGLVGIFLIYCLIGIIPPACHKKLNPKVLEKARQTRYTSPDTGPERVHFVEDNYEAMLWRIRLINSARDHILLTTFTWQEDAVGKEMTAALLNAANRGVKIRLLVDGYYGWKFLTGNPYMDALIKNPNVKERFYNRYNYAHDWKLNYRLHDKILEVDDQAYIVGGRNIQNKFLGTEGIPSERLRDFDLVVRENGTPGSDSALPSLKRYFEELWAQPNHKDSFPSAKKSEIVQAEQALNRLYEKLPERYPAAYQAIDWQKVSVPTHKITVVHGDPRPYRKEPVIGAQLYDLMSRGKVINIHSPYLMMDKTMYRAITNLNHGRSVSIVTNSVATCSNALGACDYMNQKKNIMKTGSTIFENNGRATHAKAITIDDRISVVGSCNTDMRSEYLSSEIMLVVDSRELNTIVSHAIQGLKDTSLQVNPDGSTKPGRRYKKVERKGERRLGYDLLRGVVWMMRPYL